MGVGEALQHVGQTSHIAVPGFDLVLSKLRCPSVRPGAVCRSRLLGRLALDANRPQAAVVRMRDDLTVVFGP